MKQNSPRGPSQRQLRVGELVRHAVSEVLQRGEVHDPGLDGLVLTIPEVRMSPDLKHATVFVMPLGGANMDAAIAALIRARKQIRHHVARAVNLRYAPDLKFIADPSFDEGARVEELLRSPEVARDLEPGEEAD